MIDKNLICPCCSKKYYIDCCQPIHSNPNSADSCENLMRSRYSAFVLCDISFLKFTQYPSKRELHNYKEIENWTKRVIWKKLEIIKSDGSINLNSGFVEFKAYFIENGSLDYIHGKSTFIYENLQWYYVDELN